MSRQEDIEIAVDLGMAMQACIDKSVHHTGHVYDATLSLLCNAVVQCELSREDFLKDLAHAYDLALEARKKKLAERAERTST